MSMSTYVVAFKPPGEKWQKMKAIWDACEAAGVEIPGEVEGYFEGERPDAAGVEIDRGTLIARGALRDWKGSHSEQGYEVDLTKLPKDATVIRFYNSW